MSVRSRYKKTLAKAQAGRCVIEYRVRSDKKVVDTTMPAVVASANDRNKKR